MKRGSWTEPSFALLLPVEAPQAEEKRGMTSSTSASSFQLPLQVMCLYVPVNLWTSDINFMEIPGGRKKTGKSCIDECPSAGP